MTSKCSANKNQILTASLLILMVCCFNNSTKAQLPDSILSITDTNYFQITGKVDAYIASHIDTSDVGIDSIAENDGWETNYARWKNYWETRIDGEGGFAAYSAERKAAKTNVNCSTNTINQWISLGPDEDGELIQNLGLISAISVNPDDHNDILVAGTNSCFWRTTNGGQQWKNTTDDEKLSYVGINDNQIFRQTNHPERIFAGANMNNVGVHVIENEKKDSKCDGIIGSIDGGDTWLVLPGFNELQEPVTNCIKETQFFNLAEISRLHVTDLSNPITNYVSKMLYGNKDGVFSYALNVSTNDYIDTNLFHSWDMDCIPDDFFLYDAGILSIYTSPIPAQQNKVYVTVKVMKDVTYEIRYKLMAFDYNGLTASNVDEVDLHISSNISGMSDADVDGITMDYDHKGDITLLVSFFSNSLTGRKGYAIYKKLTTDANFVFQRYVGSPTYCINNLLTFRVSPYNANVFYIECGGKYSAFFKDYSHDSRRNIMKSIDYGQTFTPFNDFYVDVRSPSFTMHPDLHAINIYHYNTIDGDDPTGAEDQICLGTDGGISKTLNGGATYTNINGKGLDIGQYYGAGVSEKDAKFIKAGAQDGSYDTYQNNGWKTDHGGDKGDFIINPTDLNSYVWTANNLLLNNAWAFNDVLPDIDNQSIVLPIEIDKKFMNKIYVGGRNLVTQIVGTTGVVPTNIYSNPENSRISSIISTTGTSDLRSSLYFSRNSFGTSQGGIFRAFENADNTWTVSEVSSNLRIPYSSGLPYPLEKAQINDIAVSDVDPDKVWIVFGNLSEGFKVFKSINGGTSWSNISGCLPNLPVFSIVYQKGSNDRIYIGTDIGVYYHDNDMTINEWEKYGENQVEASVYDLDINYCGNYLLASTYGRGIRQVPLLPNPDIIISTDVDWTSAEYVHTNVHITRGVSGASTTLRIIGSTSNPADLIISMLADKKIIIDKGCKLLVKNATITNSCNAMWEGIEVDGGASGQVLSGTDNLTNISCNQGFVYLENAVIENAHEAIKMINNPATTICGGVLHDASGMYGGIIRAVNSTFKNNRRSAEFLIYRNIPPGSMVEQKNLSFFKNCTFTTNDNHRTDHPFHAHVTMWGTYGIEFLGCTFENAVSSPPRDARDLGDGIYAIDANFSVKNLIVDQNKFIGLNRGIQVENSDNSVGFSVQNTIFENDVRCLGSTNSNFTRSRFNSFSLGNYHGGIGNYYIQSAQFDFYGNLFTKPSTTSTFFYAGSWFWNSSKTNISDHISSNNRYSNLPWGSLCNYTNRIYDGTKGLQFICNENSNNLHDFTVFDWSLDPNDGIKQNQGNASFRSGNTFSSSIATGTTNQFTQEQDNSVYYFCKTSAGDCPDAAKATATPRFNVVAIFASNACALKDYQPTTNTGGSGTWSGIQKQKMTQQELVDATAAFNLAKTNYNYYSELLQTLIDGGNTKEVVYQVNNSSAEDIATLRNYLLGFSPYLSETAFFEALKTNILPNAILFEIISNNPTLSKQLSLVDTLSTKPDPFPQWMIDYIIENTNTITFRSTLEYSIDINHQEMMQEARDIIMDMDYEADSFDHATYRTWLLSLNDAESDYMVVDNYINNSMYSEASRLLADIPTYYDLKGKQEEDYNSYLSFANWKIDVLSNNGSMDSLTENQKSDLQTIADTGMALGNMKARNVLNFFYDGTYEVMPEVPIENNNERRGNTQKLLNVNLENNYIKVYPNPSKDIVYVTFNIPCINKNASLKMIDLNGIIIYNKTIIEGIKQDVIDVAKWNAGAYQYVLECNGVKIASDKLVIIK